jgi:hypothetical protein
VLAAIDAAGNIRPAEAAQVLIDLAESDDEEIADAANQAIAMAEASLSGEDDEEGDFLGAANPGCRARGFTSHPQSRLKGGRRQDCLPPCGAGCQPAADWQSACPGRARLP